MPGIVAVLSKKKRENYNLKKMTSDLANSLYKSSRYEKVQIDDPNVSLIALSNEKDSCDCLIKNDWIISWWGNPFYNGIELCKKSVHVFENDLSVQPIERIISNLSGCFQMVLYCKKTDEIFAVSDKVSTHPLYYLDMGSHLVISPEPLPLKKMRSYGWPGHIRKSAIFELLGSEHLWGDGTYWEDVQRLGPGYYIKGNSQGWIACRYWAMQYNASSADKKELINDLILSINKDYKKIPDGKAVLTLSGGYDSRALLGLALKHNTNTEILSYTFGENFENNSDAGVAKYFADKMGLKFNFFQANLDNVLDNFYDCIIATSGESSDTACVQDGFLGANLYENLSKEYDFLIRGDEIWCKEGDTPGSLDMIFFENFLLNLNEFPQPIKIMNKSSYQEGISYLSKLRRSSVTEYMGNSNDFNEIKDFIKYRHRESRLLQNMAYFRRCYIPQYAPFLLDETLSLNCKIPNRWRLRKHLFLEAMKQEFPTLFLDSKRPPSYEKGIDRFSILCGRSDIQDFIENSLLLNPPIYFEEIFDKDKLRNWVHSSLYYVKRDKENLNYNIKMFINKMMKKNQKLSTSLKKFLLSQGILKFPIINNKYLFRMTVIACALKEYEK